jgi:acetoacetate decarboxylase
MNKNLKDVLGGGYSMPFGGALYGGPPWHLRDAQAIVARYAADNALVRRLLPAGVTPLENPVQCLAWGVTYAESALGPYNEILMYVRVAIGGRPFMYCALAYVDGDAPLAMGREVLGFPKKLAKIELERLPSGPVIFTVERPARKRLLTMSFTADRAADPKEFDLLGPAALRLIPSSTGSETPSVCELLEMQADLHMKQRPGGAADAWAGRCDVAMDSPAQTDPFHLLAPASSEIISAFQFRFDVELRPALLLKDYLRD